MVGPLGYALAFMLATTGILVVVAGLRGYGFAPSKARQDLDTSDAAVRAGLAVAALVVTFVVTGWPVAALYAAIAGAFAPSMLTAKTERAAAIERVDAIASWVETVRDTMAAAAGIEQALRVSALTAPKPIQAEVRQLSLNLQHRSTSDALRGFAADMSHPLADTVVASLLLATSRQAGSLSEVLSFVAGDARSYAAMSRQVETARTRTYSQARIVGILTSALIVISIVTRRGALQPYDSMTGQIVLFIILGLLYGSWFALYRMSKPQPPRRVFEGVERWSPVAAAVTTTETSAAQTSATQTSAAKTASRKGSRKVNGR